MANIKKDSIVVSQNTDTILNAYGYDMYYYKFETTDGQLGLYYIFCNKGFLNGKNVEDFTKLLSSESNNKCSMGNNSIFIGDPKDFNRFKINYNGLSRTVQMNPTVLKSKSAGNVERNTAGKAESKRKTKLPQSKFSTGYTRAGVKSSYAEQKSRQTSTNITGTGGIHQGSLQRNGNMGIQESRGEAGKYIQPSNPTKQPVNKLPESPFKKGYIRDGSRQIKYNGVVGPSNGKRVSNGNGNGENPNFKTTARTPGNIVGNNNPNPKPRNTFSTGMKVQTRPLRSKTYCLSDMHGEKAPYDQAMKQVQPWDRVYILGDAIDRGEQGLEILEDIIKRQEDPQHNSQITFLLGNHEVGLLNLLNIKEFFGLSPAEIKLLIRVKNLDETIRFNKSNNKDCKKENELRNSLETPYKIVRDKMKQKMSQILNKKSFKGLTEQEAVMFSFFRNKDGKDEAIEKAIDRVIRNLGVFDENGTLKTANTLSQRSKEEQDKIITFLKDSYIMVPVTENGKRYLMVHAAPQRHNQNGIWNKIYREESVKYKDVPLYNNDIWDIVEARGNDARAGYEYAHNHGFNMTICGHTPSDDGEFERGKNYILIDGACGHVERGKKANLLLYNLTDEVVKKIPAYPNKVQGKTPGGI